MLTQLPNLRRYNDPIGIFPFVSSLFDQGLSSCLPVVS